MKYLEQRKLNTVQYLLYMESKNKTKGQNKKTKSLIEQTGGCQSSGQQVGEMNEGDRKVQSSSYRKNEFWGHNIQHVVF